MESSKGVLAFRFDVDSVQCLRHGVPRLRDVASRRGVPFTFFVTFGRTFDLGSTLRQRWARWTSPPTRDRSSARRNALSTARKLRWRGLLETIALNPHLGRRYRQEIDALHADEHELGLHGGVNHATWQRGVHRLDADQLEYLFRPAFEEFAGRYGRPEGFASPGFEWNEDVLDLLDREGFAYAGDMTGDQPFRPENANGTPYRHYQVPVNVTGQDRVPVVEQGLAHGHAADRIVDEAVAQIRGRRFALMYGHPYVEGVHAAVLDKIIQCVEGEYDIVTVAEYLERWRCQHG